MLKTRAALAALAVAAILVAAQGCGGCRETPPEPVPKPVGGNVPQPDTAVKEQAVGEAKPTCAILVFTNIEEGPSPLSVQLTAEGDCTDGEARFVWDFGDGTPGATGDTVVHTFEKPGTYTVTGRISSEALPGVEDVDDVEVVVIPPQG